MPTFVLLFIIGWSLTILMAAANVLFQDCQHLIEVAIQILFYASPIMYDPGQFKERRLVSQALRLNPITSLLELLRAPLLDAHLPSTWAIGMGIGTAVVAALVAMLTLRYFRKTLDFLSVTP